MHIITVGLSHKTAPVELRELLAVPDSRMGEALQRLRTYPGIKEGMLLQTCNRVEVYAVVDQVESGFSAIQEFLVDSHLSLSAEQLLPHLYWHSGERTISHLFRVTASLDSMVVGEPQILGQVKEAFRLALTHNASGVILNKLVKKAISVAKRVRSETRIAENAVSVSYAAVELAKKVFGNLSARTVMLVGAGEMAKLAAQHLVNHGVRQVLLTTRDPVRARSVANRFQGLPIPFEEFRSEMAKADIVICSTGASHYLITAEDVLRAVRERKNRPIFLIDVSVPRNIDPAVRDVDNAFLFDIDDLEMHIEQNREERRAESVKAEVIAHEEVEVIQKWLQSLVATPTIVALRKRAEDIKQAELAKAFHRLSALSDQDREAVEGLASAIVNKLIHGPLVALKSATQSSNGSVYIDAARRFYDLDMSGNPQGGDSCVSTPQEISDQAKLNPSVAQVDVRPLVDPKVSHESQK
ncbi:MAG: glutamyl-tRNA reductase [Nitrospirae bacterium]|nr:glutamyl-tRNA reductase [Nitrospirota bacterium]MDA1302989.1 glutamyl-tRNA reductase [Nitrospirota bacterium]